MVWVLHVSCHKDKGLFVRGIPRSPGLGGKRRIKVYSRGWLQLSLGLAFPTASQALASVCSGGLTPQRCYLLDEFSKCAFKNWDVIRCYVNRDSLQKGVEYWSFRQKVLSVSEPSHVLKLKS